MNYVSKKNGMAINFNYRKGSKIACNSELAYLEINKQS